MIRRRVVVHGHVQGVFFRDSCRAEAQRQQLAGWVANRSDGTVAAVFEGDPEAVAALVTWVQQGPPEARVTSVEVTEEEPAGESGFRVR